MNIISNCPLCEEHSLHVIENQMSQCLYCGYVTTDKFKGDFDTNEEYNQLPDEMKKMAKEENDQIWIPTVMTLPMGVINPVIVDGDMFWAFSPTEDIPENEQEQFPDGKGDFYKQRYNNSKTELFKKFHIALETLNDRYMEKNDAKETKIKLPKLKKINAT